MKNRNILNYLFICLIINLIPVFLSGVFQINNTIYTFAVILAYAIQTAIMMWCVKDKVKETSKGIIKFLAIFCALQIITQIINLLQFSSIAKKDIANIISVALNIYIYFYLCSKFEITKEEFLAFMEKMILLGLFACVYNIIVKIDSIFKIFQVQQSYSLSISSFFPNRNQFGIFLFIMILSNLYIMANNKSKKYRFLQFLFIINIILTMSRNAIMGLILVYFIYLCFNFKKILKKFTKKQKIIIGIIIGVFLVIGIILLVTIPEIMDTINKLFIRSYTINPDSGRLKVWRNALEISLNNIITGVGRFKGIELNMEFYQSSLEQFHNIYLEILVAYGIIGLITAGYFMVKLLKRIKNSKIDEVDKKIMITGMIVFLVISCFESTCRFSVGYVDYISMMYFFTIPIIYSNINKIKEDKKNEP